MTHASGPSADAIRALYRAALEAAHWPQALGAVSAAVGARCACVELDDRSQGLPRRRWCSHGSEAALTPFCPATCSPADSGATPCAGEYPLDVCSWRDGSGHTHRCLQTSLELDGTHVACVRVFLERLDEVGETRARHFLSELSPHIEQALQLSAGIAGRLVELDAARLALDRFGQGFILLDTTNRVLHANAAALTILARGDGIGLRGEHVQLQREADDQRLQALLKRVRDPASGVTEQVARVERPSGARPYTLLVLAVRATGFQRVFAEGTIAMLLHDPEIAPVVSVPALVEFFGFTRAQARVAAELVSGRTLEQAAERLGITSRTARLHLQQAFRKTRTHRQSELVSLLAESAASWVSDQ